MRHVGHQVACLWVGWLCLALAGCSSGEKKTTVSGKVLENGKPLVLQGADYAEGAAAVEVTLFRLDDQGNVAAGGTAYNARVGTDGTFVLDGGDGRGIPLGTYRATLRHSGGTGGDPWQGKFDIDQTPFKAVTIAEGKELLLDIAAPPGG